MDIEKRYNFFASKVHFMNPTLGENERPIDLNLDPYKDAIQVLENTKTFDRGGLASFLKSNPESIVLLEQMVQDSHFTIAQWAYLLFDVNCLNSSSLDKTVQYLLDEIKEDDLLRQQMVESKAISGTEIPKIETLNQEEKEAIAMQGKLEISKIVKKITQQHSEYIRKKKTDQMALYVRSRITKNDSMRLKIADYLLEYRGFNQVLSSLIPREFYENKRIFDDIKRSHGEYGSTILETILKEGGFDNCSEYFSSRKKIVMRAKQLQETLVDSKYSYCRELRIESLKTPTNPISSETGKRTAKKFDFVLFYKMKPMIVVETNFYASLGGSKVSINEKEYLGLRKILELEENLRLIWVSDGNYWLTSGGKNTFKKLFPDFKHDLMNFDIFRQSIEDLKEYLRDKG